MKLQNKAFTLVELIVVITILAILGTIAFISLQGFSRDARDSARISDMKSIEKGFELLLTQDQSLPQPEDYVEITASGTVISYQGYAGEKVMGTAKVFGEGKDPLDDTYYTYVTDTNLRNYELMGFLENGDSIALNTNLLNQTKANDYSTRYPKVLGKSLGIIVDPVTKEPIQATGSGVDLGGTNSGTVYSAYINDGRTYTFSGSILNHKLYTTYNFLTYGPPLNCPDGFIPVWGDSTFNQKGFCVAKYEMTYEDAYTDINSTANYVSYNPDRKVVSMEDRYVISNITAQESVSSCASMGENYHLITENEWLTIARQIELEKYNWSGGEVGNGFIYNGVSGDTTMGCDKSGGLETSKYLVKTGPVGNDCDIRRQHKLFNGEIIWDLAGNVGEHTNKSNTLDGSGVNSSDIFVLGTSNEQYIDWNNSEISNNERILYGPLIGKDFTDGIGGLYDLNGVNDNSTLRGMSAYDKQYSGIYALALMNTPIRKNWAMGFRCAYMK